MSTPNTWISVAMSCGASGWEHENRNACLAQSLYQRSLSAVLPRDDQVRFELDDGFQIDLHIAADFGQWLTAQGNHFLVSRPQFASCACTIGQFGSVWCQCHDFAYFVGNGHSLSCPILYADGGLDVLVSKLIHKNMGISAFFSILGKSYFAMQTHAGD